MVTARAIVFQEALCALTIQHGTYWQAEGAFQGRELAVYGCTTEDEAVQAWKQLAESTADGRVDRPE